MKTHSQAWHLDFAAAMRSPYVAINTSSEAGTARGEGQMEPSEPSQWDKQAKHRRDCEMACNFSYPLLLLSFSAAEMKC